jgi:hypothetical protein
MLPLQLNAMQKCNVLQTVHYGWYSHLVLVVHQSWMENSDMKADRGGK